MPSETIFTPEQEEQIRTIVREELGRVEQIEIILALLLRLPVNYTRYTAPSAATLVREFFPDYRPPASLRNESDIGRR